MLMNLKAKKDCLFDMISLGEVMLRLDPGDSRIRCARSFQVWEGGGEYNVARGLHRCFGMKTGVVTALVQNDVGYLIEDFICEGGVDVSMIQWKPFDGIGRRSRNGLNFTEKGYGVRGALGVSDRANTAASQMKVGDVDWESIFGQYGVRWFHTGGIFAALSETTAEVIIEAVKIAKKYGTIVSYDLNFRPSLWQDIGGQERAQAVNREIAKYIDVMLGNEEDFTKCLGFAIQGSTEQMKELNLDGYRTMIDEVSRAYPNFKVIATTLREVKTASINNWSAMAWVNGKLVKGMDFNGLEIYDRVGGGDGFASGLIYGLMTTDNIEKAINYGIVHGALAMTTPGDTSMARLEEVENLMNNGSARVQR